jgi:hypothetical protein
MQNYAKLYRTLISYDNSKKKEFKNLFRRKCDGCSQSRYSTEGQVFELAFYCRKCCATDRACECKNTPAPNGKCAECLSRLKKNKMPPKICAAYFQECGMCSNHGFILSFETHEHMKMCVPCLEKPICCEMCGSTATFFDMLCMQCYTWQEKMLSTNPFYPLVEVV